MLGELSSAPAGVKVHHRGGKQATPGGQRSGATFSGRGLLGARSGGVSRSQAPLGSCADTVIFSPPQPWSSPLKSLVTSVMSYTCSFPSFISSTALPIFPLSRSQARHREIPVKVLAAYGLLQSWSGV